MYICKLETSCEVVMCNLSRNKWQYPLPKNVCSSEENMGHKGGQRYVHDDSVLFKKACLE